jgi:hypothetical protein
MRVSFALLLAMLCGGCLGLPAANDDGLLGEWTSDLGDGGVLTLELTPGPSGVSGTMTDPSLTYVTDITSPVVDRLRFTDPSGTIVDYEVYVPASTCGDDPIPQWYAVTSMTLTALASPQPAPLLFNRISPVFNCGNVPTH